MTTLETALALDTFISILPLNSLSFPLIFALTTTSILCSPAFSNLWINVAFPAVADSIFSIVTTSGSVAPST